MVDERPATTSRREVQIRKIQRDDIERVSDVLGRAFEHDPVMTFLAKPDKRQPQRIRHMIHVVQTKLTFPFGETYVTEGFEGAALWNPPNQRPHGLRTDLGLMPAMVRVAGLTRLPQIAGVMSMMEKKHPKEPHYYLFVLGVDTPYQGQGVGTQLMAPVLERCDREGVPAYLESSNERNNPLYERNGFRIVEEVALAKDGPKLWRMWREAG